MTIVQITLTIFLVVLAIVSALIGMQMIMVLNEIRRTLNKVNQGIDNVEKQVNIVLAPLQDIRHMATSVKTGVALFERFMDKLHSDSPPRLG